MNIKVKHNVNSMVEVQLLSTGKVHSRKVLVSEVCNRNEWATLARKLEKSLTARFSTV